MSYRDGRVMLAAWGSKRTRERCRRAAYLRNESFSRWVENVLKAWLKPTPTERRGLRPWAVNYGKRRAKR